MKSPETFIDALETLSRVGLKHPPSSGEVRACRAEIAFNIFDPHIYSYLCTVGLRHHISIKDLPGLPLDIQKLLHDISILVAREPTAMREYANFLRKSSWPCGEAFAAQLINEARDREAQESKTTEATKFRQRREHPVSQQASWTTRDVVDAYQIAVYWGDPHDEGLDYETVRRLSGRARSFVEMAFARFALLETKPKQLRNALIDLSYGIELQPLLAFASWERLLQIGGRTAEDLKGFAYALNMFGGPDWKAYADSIQAEAEAKS